jgi:aspartyl-tRNA(Asn)/glutamyl-tRNA(Gln) amidotransferase subunit B
LTPLVLTDAYIDEIRGSLPELPHDRYKRYISDLGLTGYAAETLINEKFLSDYFEESLKSCKNARLLCNWITVEFAGRLKENGKTLLDVGIEPHHMAKLVQMIEDGKITGRIAKSVADDMMANPGLDPETIVAQNPDYQPMDNAGEIEQIVNQVLDENPQSIADFKAGKDKAFAFLVGCVMKLTRGKASPKLVNDLLKKKLQ